MTTPPIDLTSLVMLALAQLGDTLTKPDVPADTRVRAATAILDFASAGDFVNEAPDEDDADDGMPSTEKH